jgi:hypothetical protein
MTVGSLSMEEGVAGAVAGFVSSCPPKAGTFDKAKETMIRAGNHTERFMFSLMISRATQALTV